MRNRRGHILVEFLRMLFRHSGESRNPVSGNASVEFVCILPWLAGALMTIVGFSLFCLEGSLLQYAGFRTARILNVYHDQGVDLEMARLLPTSKQGRRVTTEIEPAKISLGFGRLKTSVPVEAALRGEMRILGRPDEQDRHGQYLQDNPVVYCGGRGEYGLCAR